MNLLRKVNSFTDERINETKNKVFKETFYLVIAICIISIFIKGIMNPISIKNIITELVVIVVSALYSLVRSIQLGIYSEETELYDKSHKTNLSTKNIIIGIVFGIILSLYFAIKNSILYGHSFGQRIWFFIIIFVAGFMIYGTFFVMITLFPHLLANSASKRQSDKNQHNN